MPSFSIAHGEAAWRKRVYNMILRGAQIGPDEIDDVGESLGDMPKGAEADLVVGTCGICHGVDRVVAVARPGRQWEAIVHRMVAIGAPIDADQAGQIISYLEANYGGAPSKAP